MSGSAAEGAAQILAATVAGMGEEADATFPAAGQAGPEAGTGAQERGEDGAEHSVVLQRQFARDAAAVPAGLAFEVRLQGDGKKPSLSLNRLMDFGMPLSYPKGTRMSRGRRAEGWRGGGRRRKRRVGQFI